jgi:hypothetical protein
MKRFDEILKILNEELVLQKEQIESLKKIINLLNQNPTLSSEYENKKKNLEKRIFLAIEAYEKYKKIAANIKSESDLVTYGDDISALICEEKEMIYNNLEGLSKTLDRWVEKASLESNKQSKKPKH